MRRRTLLALPALPALAALATPSKALAEPGAPRPLAVPLQDVNVIGGRLHGTTLYGVTTGTPAKLSGVDVRTGELRFSVPLPGAGGSYTVVPGADGALYTGTYNNGHLYRVSPEGSAVEDLGQALPGQTFVWDLAVAPDGRIFGVTFPGARLFAYDPATGLFTDLGAVASDTQQARSVEYSGGKVYAGTMTPAHLLCIDPDSGGRTELALPPGVNPATESIFDINAAGGLLLVRIGTDIKFAPLYALDLATGQWIGSPLSNVAGLDLPAPGPDGSLYVMRDNQLTAWDPVSGRVTGTGLLYPGRVYNYRGVGWVDLGDPEWPGLTLTGWFWRGELWRYNPATGRSSITPGATVPGEPIPILSLSTARDGAVLVGGYLNGFARVEPQTASVDFHRFSQTECVLDDGESIWLGAYPDARGYRYTPGVAWSSPEYSPGPPGTPDNPVRVWSLAGAADPQDRIFCMARAGRFVVSGTGPKGPTFGGALVVHDTKSGEIRVSSAGLIDRAACSLAAVSPGVVVVGSWIFGGTGSGSAPQSEGTVFAYDVVRDRVLWERKPVPGAKGYAAVLSGGPGQLWVIGDSTLAELNPVTGHTRRTVRLGEPAGGGGTWPVHVASLQPVPEKKALYAKAGGRFWCVDTRTLAATDLGLTGFGLFTALPDGDLVLSQEERLLRWTPPRALLERAIR